jgi:hypothetical protein
MIERVTSSLRLRGLETGFTAKLVKHCQTKGTVNR